MERREAAWRACWLCRRGGSYQLDHSDKVVGGRHQVACQLSPLQAAVTRSSEPANGFQCARRSLGRGNEM